MLKRRGITLRITPNVSAFGKFWHHADAVRRDHGLAQAEPFQKAHRPPFHRGGDQDVIQPFIKVAHLPFRSSTFRCQNLNERKTSQVIDEILPLARMVEQSDNAQNQTRPITVRIETRRNMHDVFNLLGKEPIGIQSRHADAEVDLSSSFQKSILWIVMSEVPDINEPAGLVVQSVVDVISESGGWGWSWFPGDVFSVGKLRRQPSGQPFENPLVRRANDLDD